ncbi:sigma-70 family RNA polymerase sigma factor [Metabacillus litoralis]|uniref:Sigma-70 family RNA polymerase sigma factor n=1 Tax=Metabacillus litoralis TaxID=152268 RepID=A0A5C6V9S3_9BACI|nr:sigma-70 family RNA polymerase sigma factor [Metabacillus litoralis]TXC82223.1 sigma-70 family RNA polymerase sigma factor [Metabacillus litoralis]
MHQAVRFVELHQQFEPMIFHIIKRLSIYKNKQEFYQIGCIALWEASQRFDKEKGEFKSYAYSYIIGRMKSALTEDRVKQEKEELFEDFSTREEVSHDDFFDILSESEFEGISTLLTVNQRKWLKGYFLYGFTPSEIAHDEGVSVSAVKGWRRDALTKLRLHITSEDLKES